jgi:hypothetical protein
MPDANSPDSSDANASHAEVESHRARIVNVARPVVDQLECGLFIGRADDGTLAFAGRCPNHLQLLGLAAMSHFALVARLKLEMSADFTIAPKLHHQFLRYGAATCYNLEGFMEMLCGSPVDGPVKDERLKRLMEEEGPWVLCYHANIRREGKPVDRCFVQVVHPNIDQCLTLVAAARVVFEDVVARKHSLDQKRFKPAYDAAVRAWPFETDDLMSKIGILGLMQRQLYNTASHISPELTRIDVSGEGRDS